jgi:predicted secreted protein
MTIKKIIVLAFFFPFLIQSMGAESIFAQGNVIMLLSKEDSGTISEIAVGDFLQIELEGNPSTGFWWHFQELDEECLELVIEETEKVSKRRLGSPVLGRWRLRAKKCGETTIKMAYYRKWEGIDKAVDRVRFTIRIR